MKNTFKTKDYFSNTKPFQKIFTNKKFVWEVISEITKYLKNCDIKVGENTKIHPTAVILGPAIIGDNCEIAPHAYLRENCLIGNNVKIGHAVEIKNSVILDGTKIAHLNYVGDSLIGSNVNISGGAIIANLRLDGKHITIRTNEQKINTNLRKFGAIVGDDSFIGLSAVLNPGTILGKNSKVYPLLSIKGVYEKDSIIKT
jgi:bifunctional N-acetylglucosamine-1-phosphate-uridyltransferase/glucosamine-1-phosphate-acetyltransferase GlmU-like protein